MAHDGPKSRPVFKKSRLRFSLTAIRHRPMKPRKMQTPATDHWRAFLVVILPYLRAAQQTVISDVVMLGHTGRGFFRQSTRQFLIVAPDAPPLPDFI
jgi:hypothetical protein